MKNALLILEDGTNLEAISFGYEKSVSGEVVFTTGMVGYPESLTDPSYKGQILIFTYPMIGNYGAPQKQFWESDRIHTKAIIVSNYIEHASHNSAVGSLSSWLKKEKIPGIIIKDTRLLTQKIREKGTILGKIEFTKKITFHDPNKENLVQKVSVKKPIIHTPKKDISFVILLIDCGVKRSIIHSLLERNIEVIQVPWNYSINRIKRHFHAVVISNGPGDPKKLTKTISNIQIFMNRKIPILGICLGNQLLALSAGGDTKKMRFGHRGQNQPCILTTQKNKLLLTTQNHGFEVSSIPKGFIPWFINLNDHTNEGIIHKKYPWMSVQFHPEAHPGPEDAGWIFDTFLSRL